MSEYVGHPFEHPIIYLNSIKNIIGDDKKTPSKILLDSLDKVSNSIPKREDDQKILNKMYKISNFYHESSKSNKRKLNLGN